MTAMRCVDEGIAPEAVDDAAVAFGMPMGPIELADTVGLDICLAVGRMLGSEGDVPRQLAAHVAAGQLGKKTGKGFYTWVNGHAQKQRPGTVPAGLGERLIGPLVAEAQSALAEGIVADADLVDAGAIFGAVSRRFAAARCDTRGPAAPPRRTDVSRGRHGPGLAFALSAGRSGRDRRQRVRVGPRSVRGELPQVRDRGPHSRAWATSITFADLDALSSTFGAWLQGSGCTRGTRVALMMPNILQYPICLFGALRAGCTVVNVNPLYTARELEHQLVDSGAEVIVVVENFAQTLSQVIARTKIRQSIVTSIGEMLGRQGQDRRSGAAAREEA